MQASHTRVRQAGSSHEKLGEITLDGAVVSRVHGDPKHMYRFHVREGAGAEMAGATHGASGSGRTFDLRAHSEEEMEAWCDAVQNTIERCSGEHVLAAAVAKSMSGNSGMTLTRI